MNVLLVREAAIKLGICTERVFGLAFNWAECRVSRKYIMEQFKNWYFNGKIHPVVEDFVIDVLAGRVKQPEGKK